MKNLNDNRISTFELPPERKPNIGLVWLLNLIPYTGAGYFYAMGAERAAKPMLFFWIFMFVFGPLTLLPVYFILSALGTAHILNEERKKKSLEFRLHETVSSENLVQPVPKGRQLPLGESPEFASAAFMNRINRKKQILKPRQDGDDKSSHALEAFEYKALAAERQLQARNEAESRAVQLNDDPAENAEFWSSDFKSEDSNSDAVRGLLQSQSEVSQQDSSDYINQINNSYSAIAAPDAPNIVPEPSAVLINSDQLIPDVGSVLVNSSQVLPEVSSMLVDSTQMTPEVSSTLVDSTQMTPEVSSTLVDSTQMTPEVSSTLVDSTQITPEVSSTLVDSTQMTPEVSSTLVDSTQSISVGDFELPKFEFSFEDHLSVPLGTASGASGASGVSGASATQCPKCGAARDTNFSFCLACGQSFLS